MKTFPSMRVLVVSSKYPPEYAGSGFRAYNTYARLARKFDITFEVVANSEEFSYDDEYYCRGVFVKRFAKQKSEHTTIATNYLQRVKKSFLTFRNYLTLGHKTLRHLKRAKYDLIHTFGDSISVHVAMYFARWNNIPLVREICNTQTSMRPQPVLPFRLHKVAPYHYEGKVKVVAISKGVATNLQKMGVSPNLIWERPNPINEELYYYDKSKRSELRCKLSKFVETDVVLLSISKFIPSKNQLFLVDVLKKLPETYKILMCGPIVKGGPNFVRDVRYLNTIRDRIKKLNLEDRIQIKLGFVVNMQDYYRLADVFCFPTLIEALGTPMIEAIACGTPVVANRIRGVTDFWIINGKRGYVCNTRPDMSRAGYVYDSNPDEFAEKIRQAVEIEEDVLEAESKKILRLASTYVIDKQYYSMFLKLLNLTHGEIVA